MFENSGIFFLFSLSAKRTKILSIHILFYLVFNVYCNYLYFSFLISFHFNGNCSIFGYRYLLNFEFILLCRFLPIHSFSPMKNFYVSLKQYLKLEYSITNVHFLLYKKNGCEKAISLFIQ